MDAHYQVLAQALLLACPEDFSKGELTARLSEGFSTVRFNCDVNSKRIEGIAGDGVDDFAVDDALHALRNQMTIPGQEPWSRCTFTLFPDGKFKFDVEYDD